MRQHKKSGLTRIPGGGCTDMRRGFTPSIAEKMPQISNDLARSTLHENDNANSLVVFPACTISYLSLTFSITLPITTLALSGAVLTEMRLTGARAVAKDMVRIDNEDTSFVERRNDIRWYEGRSWSRKGEFQWRRLGRPKSTVGTALIFTKDHTKISRPNGVILFARTIQVAVHLMDDAGE